METQLPFPKKGAEPAQFSAHLYCGQTAAWMKTPLGTEVGLGLRNIVFDVDPATPRKRAHSPLPNFGPYVYCGQMAGWMKTPLGTAVDLGPGHIVLDGVPAPAKRVQQPPPSFRPMSILDLDLVIGLQLLTLAKTACANKVADQELSCR